MPTEPRGAFDQSCKVTNQLESSVACSKRGKSLCSGFNSLLRGFNETDGDFNC